MKYNYIRVGISYPEADDIDQINNATDLNDVRVCMLAGVETNLVYSLSIFADDNRDEAICICTEYMNVMLEFVDMAERVFYNATELNITLHEHNTTKEALEVVAFNLNTKRAQLSEVVQAIVDGTIEQHYQWI